MERKRRENEFIHEKQAKIIITCAKFVPYTFIGWPVSAMGVCLALHFAPFANGM